jgi:hypothetical protein
VEQESGDSDQDVQVTARDREDDVGAWPFSPGAARALLGARSEAKASGRPVVGTVHLLLALLNDEHGVAGQVLREIAKEEDIRARIQWHLYPPPVPGFEDYPRPWGSGVVHDELGRPVMEGSRPKQYFIDKNGRPVRNASGRLVHFRLDESGKRIFDSDGNPILAEVPLSEKSFDYKGREL